MVTGVAAKVVWVASHSGFEFLERFFAMDTDYLATGFCLSFASIGNYALPTTVLSWSRWHCFKRLSASLTNDGEIFLSLLGKTPFPPCNICARCRASGGLALDATDFCLKGLGADGTDKGNGRF